MDYVLYLDWGALVINLIIAVNLIYKKTIRSQKTSIFMAMSLASFLALMFDILGTYMINGSIDVSIHVSYIVNILYYLVLNITAPLFLLYVCTISGRMARISRKRALLVFIPYMVGALMIVSTPFTHGVFYFGENREYLHGPLLYVLYAVGELYLVAAYAVAVLHRRSLTREQAVSTFCFLGGSMLAVFIQMFIPKILITQFAASITLLLIYMTIQNPEDFLDRVAGTFNRKAFLTMFNERTSAGKSIDIVALRVFDMDYLSHTLGSENADSILKLVIGELHRIAGSATLFKISHTKYAFLADHDQCIFEYLPNRIRELFSTPFDYNGLSIALSAPTCCISSPEIVKSPDEALTMIEYYLETKAVDNAGDVMWGQKQVMEGHSREERLLNLMRETVTGDGFYVVYQPIYSVADDGFTEAEALVRLKSTSELGFVSPEEFIPLAEKNGLISQIGESVVRQVCEFLADGMPESIKHVNINLSVVQCMQEDLHRRLTNLIDEYEIDHNLITFEITETSAANSMDVVKNNMNRLIASGFDFAMDDFGSGFSGTGYLIDYPFVILKLDKHIVWEAFKSAKAMSVLKNTVRMIKEMDMVIVAEGVETEEQAKALKAMGCDMLQGYLYSQPIPKEELLEFLQPKCSLEVL